VTGHQRDHCPYCRNRFEIVCVKFRFSSVVILSACPNCGAAAADQNRELQPLDRINENPDTDSVRSVTEALKSRYRVSLAWLVGAVVTAAFLRHTIHVHAGISPEHIRDGAVMAAVIAVAVLTFIIVRKRPKA
jgi:hypothetical protein